MNSEKDLAKKLLAVIKQNQPTITRENNNLNFTWQGQTVTLPLISNQVQSDRTISFR